jgi:8-oxo-dGTP pyrophosphatase MutT (NUDIX family)
MTTPSADDYRRAMARHPRLELPALPGRRNHLKTGVLVPLVWRGDDVDCVLTVRSRQLRTHGGEVSFPGGRPEGDESLDATALREAEEELGISKAEILGELSSVPLYTSDFRLFPFVAAIADAPLTPSPDEVAEVLTVSVSELLARDHFDAIAWDLGAMSGVTPVFELGEQLVFGATAHTLYELVVLSGPLFGREPPPLETGRFDWDEVFRRQVG